MARYQIWDKMTDIITPSGAKFTAKEWAEQYDWVKKPGAKMIIGGGCINGSVAMEFDETVKYYKRIGADIHDGMTDDEVLSAIEAYEDSFEPITLDKIYNRIANIEKLLQHIVSKMNGEQHD